MRHVLVAIVISASTTVGAQPVSRGAAQPPPPRRTPGVARPRAATPALPPPATVAPPIVLPLPPLMTPPAGGLTQGFPFTPTNPTNPQRDLYRARRQHPRQAGTTVPIVGGYFGIAEPAASAPAVEPPPAVTGFVRLLVTPAKAQVFVDSYYVGTVEDIEATRALTVDAGPHRIEIRAPGYQTLTVDVRVAPQETVTYRGALEPPRPSASERDRPAASTAPIYVIPNCYLGNIPPRPQRLPPGCDIRNVHVLAGT